MLTEQRDTVFCLTLFSVKATSARHKGNSYYRLGMGLGESVPERDVVSFHPSVSLGVCVCPPPRHTTENNLDSTSNSICRGKGAAAADYAHSHSPPAPCNMHEKAHEREKEE